MDAKVISTVSARACTTCRHFSQQESYIGRKWIIYPHCAHWYECFPDATHCEAYRSRPESEKKPVSPPALPANPG